jgi:hypothetical protein
MTAAKVVTAAQRQRNIGGQRVPSVYRSVRPHPRKGGSQGYDIAFRTSELGLAQRGLQPTTASRRSIFRWRRRLVSYVKSGCAQRCGINGVNMYHLCVYRLVYPKANLDEVRRFIFENAPPSSVKVFTRSEVSEAETRLSLTHKRGSTTAHQALDPVVLHRRSLFWTRPYPLGCFGIPLHRLGDFDECGIYLQVANRNHGKAYVNVRVREFGPYGHDEKWTLMMLIMASGFKHFFFDKVSGTTKKRFRDFTQSVIPRLVGMGGITCLMDNLESHFDAQAWAMFRAAGNRFLPRAPYWPVDGPIEYVFNTIECELRQRLYKIRSDADLCREVLNIISSLSNLGKYFVHCGY